MAPSALPRPPHNRSQWLISSLLLSALLLLAILNITGPDQTDEQRFKEAETVPLSVINAGYHEERFEKILIRDNIVYAIPSGSGAVLQSYKAAERIADLGWNDPDNATVVEIENRETTHMLYAVL